MNALSGIPMNASTQGFLALSAGTGVVGAYYGYSRGRADRGSKMIGYGILGLALPFIGLVVADQIHKGLS